MSEGSLLERIMVHEEPTLMLCTRSTLFLGPLKRNYHWCLLEAARPMSELVCFEPNLKRALYPGAASVVLKRPGGRRSSNFQGGHYHARRTAWVMADRCRAAIVPPANEGDLLSSRVVGTSDPLHTVFKREYRFFCSTREETCPAEKAFSPFGCFSAAGKTPSSSSRLRRPVWRLV